MARLETYTCNGCGSIKYKANHWWDVLVIPDGKEFPDTLRITAHCDPAPSNTQQMCGIECAQKFIAQWMARTSSSVTESNVE